MISNNIKNIFKKNFKKKIKKVLSIILVLSLINGVAAFSNDEFVSEMNIINIKTFSGKPVKNFSIGDVVYAENDGVDFDYNNKLKVQVLKGGKFKFNDFKSGELLAGQVVISSLSDYSVKIGDKILKIKNSGVAIEKDEDDGEINILSNYGINKIIFNGGEKFLLEGYKAQIFGKNISVDKNISDQIDLKNKIYAEDDKKIFNISGFNQKFLSDLIIFKNTKEEILSDSEKNIFNKCIDSIGKLSEKEKDGVKNISNFYKNVEKKCINEKILNNKKFLEKFEENFDNISSLSEKYFIDQKKKEFFGKKMSFIDNIFYLQKNISSADIKKFPFFLDEAKKSLENENNLKNLEIGFILVDGILKNNLKFSFEKLYDFRNKISYKILDKFYTIGGEKLISKIKENIDFNSKFIEKLLENKNFKELDYIFSNKIIYENQNNNKELADVLDKYEKSWKDYGKLLDSSKNILHGSAEKDDKKDVEKLKEEELKRQKKEAELKALLDSFKTKKIEEVKITSDEQRSEILKKFKKAGFEIDSKNIEGFMKGGNLFYVNKIKFLGKTYDVVYSLADGMVLNIKGDKFSGDESMSLQRFKTLIEKNDFKIASFSDKPSNVFGNLEEKNFSYEDFLKIEVVRKYLESVGIIMDKENIEKIDGKNFKIKGSKIKKFDDLMIGFNIELITWNVSNINLSKGDDFKPLAGFKWQSRLDKIVLAKNLKSGIEKIYGDYVLRNENLEKVLVNLAKIGIKKDDYFLGKNSVDGFKIYKGFEMSSGNGILSGEYFVSKNIFTSARFTLKDHIEDFKNISPSNLAERMKYINKNISDLEKLKSEEELAIIREQQRLEKIRILNYGKDVPDELLNGDWITD